MTMRSDILFPRLAQEHLSVLSQIDCAFPADASTLGKYLERAPKKHMGKRQLAAIIRAQLRNVARHRMKTLDALDVVSFVRAFALALGSAPAGPYRFRGSLSTFSTWRGLDMDELKAELRALGIVASDDMMIDALDFASRPNPPRISVVIGLTKAERTFHKAYNLGRCDGVTKEGHKKELRQIDAARNMANRRLRGAIPRADYEGNSQERRAPWVNAGISRSTWFRIGKPIFSSETGMNETGPSVAHTCIIGEPVCDPIHPPPIHELIKSLDRALSPSNDNTASKRVYSMAGLFPLRPLQQDALDGLKSSIMAGKRRIIVQAPTGFGKSILGAHMVAGALAKGNRVAFVVPQLSLIDQTFEKFSENGISPGDMGVMQANHPWRRPHAPVQICSVQTIDRRGFPDVKFVIVDEVHVRFKAVDRWISERPDALFFGLSATPWSKGLGDVWDDLVIPATLSGLIDAGWLAKFRVFASAEKPDLSKVKTVAGDYHEGQLADVMGAKRIVADVVSTWLEKGEDRPTLCFAVNRAHADVLHRQFSEAGIGSAYIDGETPREDRLEILERYGRGDVRVICSVGTMIVGVDVTCRCIIDAAPTKSEIRHVQKIGRGLRNEPGKENLILLDHAGNCLRLGLPTSIGRSTLRTAKSDAAAKEAGEKPEAERSEPLPRECGVCHALVPPKTRVCPSCGAESRRQCNIETIDGELVEMGMQPKPKGKESVIDRLRKQGKQAIHAQLVSLQGDRKKGWIAHTYREIFGVFPSGIAMYERSEPTPELQIWLHSRRIKWAKSKQRERVSINATSDDARGLSDAA